MPEELEMTVKIREPEARLLQAVALETGDTVGNIIGWMVSLKHNKSELLKLAPGYAHKKHSPSKGE